MKKILIVIMLLTTALAAFAVAAPAGKGHGGSPRYREGELLVKFKPGTPAKELEVQALSVGAQKIRTFSDIGVQHMKLPKGMSVEDGIRLYRENPDVEYAEPNYIIHADAAPDDTYYDTLWGLNNTGQTGGLPGADIQAEDAWNIQTGSSSVVVAVMDSGIDYNHPDLKDNIWHNAGETNCSDNVDNDGNGKKDDCIGWDFVDVDNEPLDLDGHGTHVAGTIGAVGNNTYGITGVNWNVSLMNLRILDASGEGTVSAAVAAITYAKQNGANVVNCSWGGPDYSSTLKGAIDNAPSLLFVCAAGNDGNNTDIVGHYPSGYQSANIISVAASDDNDTLASWSNYGALSVDLAAPGVAINSTTPGQNIIWSDNFDDGNISDWTTGGTNNSWGVTTEVSNTPSYSLADSPGGNYVDNTNSWAEAPVLDFSNQVGCHMSYKIRYNLEYDFDRLYVEASGNGSSWTILDNAYWTGTQNTFRSYTEDLTAWDGDPTVYFRFRLKSDASVVDDGVYIDDLEATCTSSDPSNYTGDEFKKMSGTSMAAPHVSGVAALLIANIPTLNVLDVKNVLIHTIDPTVSGAPTTDWSVSNGRVNAYNALIVDPANLPPTAPSNLRASVNSKTSVKLTWHDNSNDEDVFSLERKDGSSGIFAEITAPLANATSYTDKGLTTGIKYTYRIRAFNANGPSPYSNEAAATPKSSSSSGGGNGFIPGCFIATAAYGSPLAGEVQVLRDFRDRELLHSALGRKLVKLYYRYSPGAARVIARHPALRAATRAALYPVVFTVKHPGGAGGAMVLIISAALFAATRKKWRKSCDA